MASVFDADTRRRIAAIRLRLQRLLAGEGAGALRARGVGEGQDFHDHRPYASGDDFRHIDWNLFGRQGDLFVKRFRLEGGVSFLVLLDRSASMTVGTPSKDVCARRLAVALAGALQGPDRPFTIRLLEDGLPRCGPVMRRESDLEGAMNALEELPAARSRGGFRRPLTWEPPRGTRQVVILLGDGLDGASWMSSWSALRSRDCEVVFGLLSAEEERCPTWKGTLHLEDLEGPDALRLSVDRNTLSHYTRLFDEHLQECRRVARGQRCQTAFLSAEWPLEEALLALVREGAWVK